MPARYSGRDSASEDDRETIVLSRSKKAAWIIVDIVRLGCPRARWTHREHRPSGGCGGAGRPWGRPAGDAGDAGDHNVARPTQVSPLATLRAVARTVSSPAVFLARMSTSNEPLGARLTRRPAKIWSPSCAIRTAHVCPM